MAATNSQLCSTGKFGTWGSAIAEFPDLGREDAAARLFWTMYRDQPCKHAGRTACQVRACHRFEDSIDAWHYAPQSFLTRAREVDRVKRRSSSNPLMGLRSLAIRASAITG